MSWLEEVLDTLAAGPVCGYHAGSPPASEPTALAALALLAHDRLEPAQQAADWLVKLQAQDGSVGIGQNQSTPTWPTSLAMLAWQAAVTGRNDGKEAPLEPHIDLAATWAIELRGTALPRDPKLGHDTTLVAWPWCEGTHSWLEPTAFFVLREAVGMNSHERTREAVRMLFDRQLAAGGCNYGNTVVLGQTLRPHIQPTGIAMLALAGEPEAALKARLSLRFLHTALKAETTTASLCWGLLGLAAHGHTPLEADDWLAAAFRRTWERDKSLHKFALLALAALAERSPLVTLPKGPAKP